MKCKTSLRTTTKITVIILIIKPMIIWQQNANECTLISSQDPPRAKAGKAWDWLTLNCRTQRLSRSVRGVITPTHYISGRAPPLAEEVTFRRCALDIIVSAKSHFRQDEYLPEDGLVDCTSPFGGGAPRGAARDAPGYNSPVDDYAPKTLHCCASAPILTLKNDYPY